MHLFAADDIHGQKSLRDFKHVINRCGKSHQNFGLDHQTVHHDFNRVLDIFVEFDFLGKFVHIAVDSGTYVTVLSGTLQNLGMLALLPPDDRRKELDFCALGQLHNLVRHFVHGLSFDYLAAVRAVRNTDSRIEQTEVIVNLRHGSDRGTRVAVRGFLVDADGR